MSLSSSIIALLIVIVNSAPSQDKRPFRSLPIRNHLVDQNKSSFPEITIAPSKHFTRLWGCRVLFWPFLSERRFISDPLRIHFEITTSIPFISDSFHTLSTSTMATYLSGVLLVVLRQTLSESCCRLLLRLVNIRRQKQTKVYFGVKKLGGKSNGNGMFKQVNCCLSHLPISP